MNRNVRVASMTAVHVSLDACATSILMHSVKKYVRACEEKSRGIKECVADSLLCAENASQDVRAIGINHIIKARSRGTRMLSQENTHQDACAVATVSQVRSAIPDACARVTRVRDEMALTWASIL